MVKLDGRERQRRRAVSYLSRRSATGVRMYGLKGKRVFVAGHRGLVGSAITRRLACEDCEIVTATRDEVDLADQSAVRKWMAANQPDAIVLAAAKVGGILANDTYPADFLYPNLMIQANVIEAA